MHRGSIKTKRQVRARKKIVGLKDRPRLSVFRSNKFVYAQVIDDEKGVTLVGASEKELTKNTGKPMERAKELGLLIAQRAIALKIKKMVFDRRQYSYHGAVQKIAEGVREGGIEV